MQIFYGYRNVTGLKDPIVAIGMFDGVHIGHKKVITRLLSNKNINRSRVIITFDPHPDTIIDPKKPHLRIMSLEHRLYIFKKMGIDCVIVLRFNEVLARMKPEEFVKKVLKKIGCSKVFVGSNFYFGKDKTGDADRFVEIGAFYGIKVSKVTPVRKANKIVSSTWVRKLVSRGDIRKAEEILRRPVSILGTVVKGDERGHELGFPTANIDPHHEVIPPSGVYAVKIEVDSRIYDGVLNIGFIPTFYGNILKRGKTPRIEVHIFGFKRHLYGLDIEIFFIKKLRREKKFRTGKALIEQIEKDKDQAERFLKSPRISGKIKKYKHIK